PALRRPRTHPGLPDQSPRVHRGRHQPKPRRRNRQHPTTHGRQVRDAQPPPNKDGMTSPGALPAVHAGVMVYVDDVDAHFEQATSAGATIWYEPQDMPYGQREYGVRDPENGFWCFGELFR